MQKFVQPPQLFPSPIKVLKSLPQFREIIRDEAKKKFWCIICSQNCIICAPSLAGLKWLIMIEDRMRMCGDRGCISRWYNITILTAACRAAPQTCTSWWLTCQMQRYRMRFDDSSLETYSWGYISFYTKTGKWHGWTNCQYMKDRWPSNQINRLQMFALFLEGAKTNSIARNVS